MRRHRLNHPRFVKPRDPDAKQAERIYPRTGRLVGAKPDEEAANGPDHPSFTLPVATASGRKRRRYHCGDVANDISKSLWQKSDQRHRGRCGILIWPGRSTQMPTSPNPLPELTPKHKRNEAGNATTCPHHGLAPWQDLYGRSGQKSTIRTRHQDGWYS